MKPIAEESTSRSLAGHGGLGMPKVKGIYGTTKEAAEESFWALEIIAGAKALIILFSTRYGTTKVMP